MKTKLKVACASVNQIPLDWKGNFDNISSAIRQAYYEKVDLILFPELCITGYGCEDAFFMPNTTSKALVYLELIRGLCSELNITAIVGLPFIYNGAMYNTACVLSPKTSDPYIFIPKQNLCSDGIHYEPRWFKPWKYNEVFNIYVKGFKAVIGKTTLSINNIKIGIEICEDAWVHNRPGIDLANNSVDIICNPSASHFSFGKHEIRETLVKNSSRSLNAAYLYANLVGNEAGRAIYDGDCMICNQGEIITRSKELSFKKSNIIYAVIDTAQNNVRRIQSGSFSTSNRIINSLNITTPCKDNIYNSRSKNYRIDSNNFHLFEKAVCLGLWDYMLKTSSKGFVVSLSGGVDSTVTAYLIYKMIELIQENLDEGVFISTLLHNNLLNQDEINIIFSKENQYSVTNLICEKLLTCIYQSTSNSSDKTEESAMDFAKYIGAKFSNISIESICNNYKQISESILSREITWETDDLALQNIQARARGPVVWMIANIKNALLLSTSNRSEAAVGYATMDGDTCGGLAPICGVSKEFLLEYVNFKAFNEKNYHFENVLCLKPTAELKPKEFEQTDETDLMPYSILNSIEVMVVKYKMSPEDVLEALKEQYPHVKHKEYVEKFFTLFSRNQWKRERYAPAFHLDDESLDPKTFYRFPILNSSFKQELTKLK